VTDKDAEAAGFKDPGRCDDLVPYLLGHNATARPTQGRQLHLALVLTPMPHSPSPSVSYLHTAVGWT